MHAKTHQHTLMCYLISKEHHDSVAASSWRSVFNGEGVIIVSDYVKVNVRLSRSHNTRSTLNPNADVTYRDMESCILEVIETKDGFDDLEVMSVKLL